MGPIFLPFALIAYFVGVVFAFVDTAKRSKTARAVSTTSLVVAWVLHLAAVVHLAILRGHFPLSNMPEYLLVLGWIVLTLHLLVWFRWRVVAASLVLPPLAALMAMPALWFPGQAGEVALGHQHSLFIFHTTAATLGMAALCVAFAMSLIYLVQDGALKSKRVPRVLARLPSLEACDRIGYLAILWGFPLLTLGVATGLLWSRDVHDRFFAGGAKQYFPLLAWVVFAALLYARVVRGMGARRSAYITIAGFTLGLLTVLGMTI